MTITKESLHMVGYQMKQRIQPKTKPIRHRSLVDFYRYADCTIRKFRLKLVLGRLSIDV